MPLARRMQMAAAGVGGLTYLQNVLDLSPIAYWPLNETSGTNADNAEGTAARDGTYTGVTLNSTASPITGDNAPLWDAVNDYCDIYSSSLNTAFNPAELTLSLWFKANSAGTWTDGANRYFMTLRATATNRVLLFKTTTDNQFVWNYDAGGTTDQVSTTTLFAGSTSWHHVALTVSVSNDRMRAYADGSQEGIDQTGLGTWSGALNSTVCDIGAVNNSGALSWDGYISHVAVFDYELTAAQIVTLATAV